MKQILDLNAFDVASAANLDTRLAGSVRRRSELFGAASVLFYEHPLEFRRGEGCWLYDADGIAYLDAYNNVPCVGHCHPRIVAAAARQLAALNVHTRYLHPAILDYAERLLGTLPPALGNVAFTCTGSESNDLALRLAARFTGGPGIIVTEAAYHGNTAAVTAISPASLKSGAPPAHVRVISAPRTAAPGGASVAAALAGQVTAAIDDLDRAGIRCGALILDTIFSSDGVYADPPGFLGAAVEAVHRAGGLFIADEVQPGFGRTGETFWGFARHGVVPDIVTMGKPMGNGHPMGAVVTRPEILDAFSATVGYFNTFAGTPVAAAVGLAVLDVIEQEGLMANARAVGAHLIAGLHALGLRHPEIREVRGAGLYVGVDLTPPADALATRVINGLRERRVLIGAAGRDGNVLKIRPPLCFSAAHADTLIAALDATLSALRP
jgi:4-aminobutyrate aminotransferase-like enzyme